MARETRTRYGRAHPERVENPLWEQAIREDWSGYGLRRHLGIELDANHFRQDFSHSSYRDSTPGPFWSWQRFGRTSTRLPDGRIIHIAGEHEDAYDPDFCIYNDVVVEHPDGRREFYLYPADVFPPTDFHTATLVGDDIILIGSLGYRDLRRGGETQIMKLDTRTLRFERLVAPGDGPGWISRHTAERLGETCILVVGGKVDTGNGYEPNTGMFVLDLATMTWSRRPHGDTRLFPVSPEAYRAGKSPRYGTANPERSSNPFWLEMARRRWPPSRARFHFGDFAPPQPELVLPDEPDGPMPESGTPEAAARMARMDAALDARKLKRTIDDVVWTAVREYALELDLPDGRRLAIGGEVADYGEEYADPWNYTDIVVTHPDGRVEILTYPIEVVPHALWLAGALMDARAYLFALIDRKRHPDRPREPLVLQLDPTTYEITPLPVAPPPVRLALYPHCAVRAGNRLVFPNLRRDGSEPELGVPFNLETLGWDEPFPYAHPSIELN